MAALAATPKLCSAPVRCGVLRSGQSLASGPCKRLVDSEPMSGGQVAGRRPTLHGAQIVSSSAPQHSGCPPAPLAPRFPFFRFGKTASGARAVDPTDPAWRGRKSLGLLQQLEEDGRNEGSAMAARYGAASALFSFQQLSSALMGVLIGMSVRGRWHPVFFTMARSIVSVVPMIAVACAVERVFVRSRSGWFRAAGILGACCITPNMVTVSYAIMWSSPIMMALFSQSVPLLASCISMLRRQEPFSWLKLLAIVVSLGGCVVMILNPLAGAGASLGVSLKGLAALLLNVVGSVAYLFLTKWISQAEPTVPPLTATALSLVGSTLMTALVTAVVFTLIEPDADPLYPLHHGASAVEVIAVLWAGLGQSCASFAAGNFAIRWSDPSYGSLFVPLQPIFTAFLALVVVGDVPTASQYVGGSMALAGLCLVLWLRRMEYRRSVRLQQKDNAAPEVELDLVASRDVSAGATQSSGDGFDEDSDVIGLLHRRSHGVAPDSHDDLPLS